MSMYAIRRGKLQFQSEIKRIKTEQESDMRMLNNEKQRFRAKYSKLDMYHTNRNNFGVVSDVRMYATHNPGFCYKRNGEPRISSQTTSTIPTVDYDGMHTLLFTENCLDIDKVLVLHLLTAHKTETLKPARKSRAIKTSIAKERSPVERLLERSKRKSVDENIIKELPIYILDVTPSAQYQSENKIGNDKILIRDGRLATRLLVNDKIMQLISSVFAALRSTNPTKLQNILTKAHNPAELSRIMEKPHIVSFVRGLRDHMLISSCESFHLTQPFKVKSIPLEIFTTSGALEDLVTEIRATVLSGSGLNFRHKSIANPSMSSNNTGQDLMSFFEDEQLLRSTIYSSKRKSADTMEERSLSYRSKKASDDSVYPMDGSFDAARLAVLLSKKAENASNRDAIRMRTLMLLQETEEPDEYTPPPRPKPLSTAASLLSETTYKQTNCPACKLKWKEPYPHPHASRIKKSCLPKVDDYSIKDIKSESMRRISKVIDKELVKVKQVSNTKGSNEKSINSYRIHSQVSPLAATYVRKLAVDTIKLNELDLARIRQEIKENETANKLSRFSNLMSGKKKK